MLSSPFSFSLHQFRRDCEIPNHKCHFGFIPALGDGLLAKGTVELLIGLVCDCNRHNLLFNECYDTAGKRSLQVDRYFQPLSHINIFYKLIFPFQITMNLKIWQVTSV